MARIGSRLVITLVLPLFAARPDAKPQASQKLCENPKEVTFKRDVLPPLQESCASCHHSEQNVPALDLREQAAYENVVGKKSMFVDELLIKPGDPDHSFLVEKIAGKPRFGQKMPPYGRPLTPRELKVIIDWIRLGAKNN